MKHEYADKYVQCVGDIPQQDHWAIFESSSVHVPGDQRSIDAPGHGYPAYAVNFVNYEVYLTEDKWRRQIEYKTNPQSGSPKSFVAVQIRRAKIKAETRIEVT